GTNWTQVSTGLTNTIIWALAVSGTNLFAGTNGNGVWRRPLDEIIPVELISFTASVTGNTVTLRWTTATELNNLGFEVQRSIENKNWNAIAFVEGTGTTTSSQNYGCVDNSVSSGTYFYRLKQVDFNGNFEFSSVVEVIVGLPNEFVLAQNYPNPFNPSTSITYQIAVSNPVYLKIYNVLGKEIATLVNEVQPAGNYEVTFSAQGGSASGGNAYSLSSGTYFYTLQAGSFVETKKMILLK
ncbi:MAG: T9SS type A sorting domain-containing protein, partial [Anaerolineales bacterium]|nr:T9SS type A sorting domain-containing protein [Anaerolineales bacterium]